MSKSPQFITLDTARRVNAGELSRAKGAHLISRLTGIPATSAGIKIAAYVNMRAGRVYKRTLNSSDLDYFLESIANEGDPIQLKMALTAVREHIEYRRGEGFPER